MKSEIFGTDRLRNIAKKCLPEYEARFVLYAADKIDALRAENERLRGFVGHIMTLGLAAEAEVARLTALSTMKDDALDSYAEFYGRAAGMCGLPDDALPGAETDAIILQRLAEHDEIARLTAALEEANSALISMVYQYCYRPLDANKEPAIDIYQHDFMSAGEEAFAYLVEHGLAKWTDESHYAILINSKTSLSVKSDD